MWYNSIQSAFLNKIKWCRSALWSWTEAVCCGDHWWWWEMTLCMPLWKYPVVVTAWIYKPGWPNLQPVYGKPVDLLFYLIHSDFHQEEEAVWLQYLLDVLIWPDSTKLFLSSWLALCVLDQLCFYCALNAQENKIKVSYLPFHTAFITHVMHDSWLRAIFM